MTTRVGLPLIPLFYDFYWHIRDTVRTYVRAEEILLFTRILASMLLPFYFMRSKSI